MPLRIFNPPNLGVTSAIIRHPATTGIFLAMHAAKLTLAASTGVPLACWGNGLTVLLEEEFGNIYIDKMQAICLLEANYN